MAGGVRQGCVDAVCCLGEVEQFDALLDDAAEFLHPGPEQQFGVALREAEREAVPRAVVGQVEVEQPPGPRVHVHVPHSVTTRDERVRQPHGVEHLQGAGVDAQRPALGGRSGPLVDDAGLDATGQQLGGEGEPGRACTDDQDLAVGR